MSVTDAAAEVRMRSEKTGVLRSSITVAIRPAPSRTAGSVSEVPEAAAGEAAARSHSS